MGNNLNTEELDQLTRILEHLLTNTDMSKLKMKKNYQKLLQKTEICKHADHNKNGDILPDPVENRH